MEVTEFDATLGGTEHLPFSANSLKFAASRSVEIAAMTESILRPSKTKLIFQCLPVHMRRRVMSHNCKRLPRKLRQAHLEQLKKSGLPPKQKRPSRKYRRRPANLLEEYNRRQKNNTWLETHIWHAKRFHMTSCWGYRLPYAPCDKAFRACYRGSSTHCLLQDISYCSTIQITGPFESIKEMFDKVTNSSCNLGPCAKAYTNGNRMGSMHLYGKDTYPYGYIGKVDFLWVSTNDESKMLMLFVHPSQTKQIEILFQDHLDPKLNGEDYETATKKRKVTSTVDVKVFGDTFNRFRLTGPNSHSILAQSLKCIEENNTKHKWMSLHKIENLKETKEYWQALNVLTSPSQLPPNMVISLVVKDPRLSRPAKRTKAKQETYTEIDSELLVNTPDFLTNSPLWNINIHKTIKEGLLTNAQFIDHVTKTQIVPGEVNEDDPVMQSVPVVLIQRPGSQNPQFKKIGYGSGWDIIIPPKYALPFWLTFIMFGARAGGLRESESLAFEMGESYLPPDSVAGGDYEKKIKTELKDKYFRLPPSKRVNYIKIAINSPFICPWDLLLNDWSKHKVTDFFVLRNRIILNDIQECILRKRSLPDFDHSSSCLIPVYVKLTSKGNLNKHSLLCLPKSGDLTAIKTLFEPHHEDPNEKLRKIKRSEHRTLLKSLKRRRRKLRKKNITTKEKKVRGKIIRSEPSEYVKTMRELWLPSKIETVRHIPSRQVIGYVNQGSFSFTEGKTCGVGYIAYNALNVLLSKGLNQILVRNTTSRKYNLANILIINNK